MKINDYELLIVSSQEREKVYCEIYYKSKIFGEISQENDKLLLEIYSSSSNKVCLEIPLEEFQDILDVAKKHLLGKK